MLDDLLKANRSAEAYLSRYAYFLAIDSEDRKGRAAAEIDQAVTLDPNNLDVRIEASADALRRGDVDASRRHLDAIPAKEQNNYRVRLARGVVELHENKADDAIEDWRQGLILKGGTDEDLTWRLAFILLNLGRTDEAAPLLDQYRRLSGGAEPTVACRYLYALRDLKENHPIQAIRELMTLRLKATRLLQPQIEYTLGQADEAIRDDTEALDAYGLASKNAPKSASPRLARLRLLQTLRPEEAEGVIQQGLIQAPDDAGLLVALARVELQKQLRKPRDRRDWRRALDSEPLARGPPGRPQLRGPGAGRSSTIKAQLGQARRTRVGLLGQAVKHDKKDDAWSSGPTTPTAWPMRGEADGGG